VTDPRLARPSWRGRTNVDALTIAALELAESYAGKTFVVTQGSYQGGGGDLNSAGTHDGGGVLDLRWTGDSDDIGALRRAGFAAWLRTPSQGPWPYHFHIVLGGHPKLAPAAARQWDSYVIGRNGLKDNGLDDGPRLNPIPRFEWGTPQEEDVALTDDDAKKFVNTLMKRSLNSDGSLTVAMALRQGARSLTAVQNLAETLPDAIVKALPVASASGSSGLTHAQVRKAAETAVRNVLGSLNDQEG
jgi:hypothetical protein